MKKILVAILAVLMLVSLFACSGKETNTAGNGDKPDVQGSENVSSGKTETDGGSKNEEAKSAATGVDAWYESKCLNLPENLYYEYSVSSAVSKTWKIGNVFLEYSFGDYYAYVFEDGMWKEYANFDNEGEWIWQDFGDENALLCPVKGFDQERRGSNGRSFYYTKTDETKEILGKTCVKYHEDLLGDIWVDESTGMFFEMWMEGAEHWLQGIVAWDETITEFPIEVPSKFD